MKKIFLLSCLLVSSYSWALSTPVESGASSSFSFGQAIEVGASVADKTFTFKRSGSATENAGSTVSLSSSADFSIVSATGCNKELIKTSETCYVKVRLLKKTAGSYSATLQVGSPGALNEIVLSAGILAPVVPAYSLSLKDGSVDVASSLDYGPLNKNTSITKTFTLTNSGAQPAPLAISLSGAGYIISNNGCTSSLAKSSSCYFKITFSAGAGSASDESKPGSLALNQDMVISLSALVRGTPVVTGSPLIKFYESSLEITSLNYGSVASGSMSKIITVKNVGTAANNAAISLSGDAAFVQSSNNCSAALAVNASCQVRINLVYSASSLGDKTASLSSGSASLSLLGKLGGVVTYSAVFSDPPNNLVACQGSSQASQVLSLCRRDSDQAVVANNLCTQSPPTVTLQSPSGTKNISIDHGTEVVSCAQGSSVETHVSTNCDSGYQSLSAGSCSLIPVSAPSAFTLLNDFSFEVQGGGGGSGSCQVRMGPEDNNDLVATYVMENAFGEPIDSEIQASVCQYFREGGTFQMGPHYFEDYDFMKFNLSYSAAQQIRMMTGSPYPDFFFTQGYFDFTVGNYPAFSTFDAYMNFQMAYDFQQGSSGPTMLTDGTPNFLTKYQDSVYYGVAAGGQDHFYLMRKMANDTVQMLAPNYKFMLSMTKSNLTVFKNKLYMIGKDENNNYRLMFIDSQQNGFSVGNDLPPINENTMVMANENYLIYYSPNQPSQVTVITDDFNHFGIANPSHNLDFLSAGAFVGNVYYGKGYGGGGTPVMHKIDIVNQTISIPVTHTANAITDPIVLGMNGGKLWILMTSPAKTFISIDNQGVVTSTAMSQGQVGYRFYSRDIIYYNSGSDFYKIQDGQVTSLGSHPTANGGQIAPDGSLLYNEYAQTNGSGPFLYHIRRLTPQGSSSRIENLARFINEDFGENLAPYERFWSNNHVRNHLVSLGFKIDNFGNAVGGESVFMINAATFSLRTDISPCLSEHGTLVGNQFGHYLRDGNIMFMGAKSCGLNNMELHRLD